MPCPTLRPLPLLLGSALLALLACGGSSSSGPLLPENVLLHGPADPMPTLGGRVVFQAEVDKAAEPAGEFLYQWTRDGVAIPSATSPTLILDPVTSGDAGAYRVLVTGPRLPYPAGPVLPAAFSSTPFELEPVDHGLIVTTLADGGLGSLRAALAQAATLSGLVGLRFQLPTGIPWVIFLTSPLPPITTSLSILGPTEQPLVLSGVQLYRPFFVDKGGTLTLDNFTVYGGLAQGGNAPGGGGGAAGMGGAMFINKGKVTLRHMTFRDNQALGGASRPGYDGENGGGAGFSADSPATGGNGADGGLLAGMGGTGHLDGTATTDLGGGPALGDGAGGGAARGGLLNTLVVSWADNLPGGDASFGGGGGFSVGPLGGGGNGSEFGGGGGSSGGSAQGVFLPGSAGGAGGVFGGDGVPGNGVTGGIGGGGGGMGGAIFLRSGTLNLVECTFQNNLAQGGAGAKGQDGLGKGGALFIYAYDFTSGTPFDLNVLKQQTYTGNVATDLVEDPSFDNADYYVAQTTLASKRNPAFDLLYRRYRLDRMMGVPWIRPVAPPVPR